MTHRFPMTIGASRAVTYAARALALLALAGCAKDPAAPALQSDPAKIFWSVTLDQRAITLSTVPQYDTLRITATPRNALGTPIAGAPAVVYKSTDPDHLVVGTDGVLHALQPGNAIRVIATATMDGVTHTDTAIVNVTTESHPPVLTSFSLAIPPEATHIPMWPTSLVATILGFNFYGSLPAVFLGVNALDAEGNPIPGIAIDYQSTDSSIVEIDGLDGLAKGGLRPGQAKLIASATVYGVTMTDTITLSVDLPLVAAFQFYYPTVDSHTPALSATGLTITTGGYVAFFNTTMKPIDIVFDDPANVEEDPVMCSIDPQLCGAGDIAAFGDTTSADFSFANLRVRRFPVAGTYRWHSPLTGFSGVITVEDPMFATRRVRQP
ncbi:MAG: hypothetical protein IRY91_08270 [Gemmatimonadaceae bacterium]|nr:hypothetical protein [Gemmatimonadaceae bacterium]